MLRALADLIPLEVGQDGQHLENHPARCRGGVDPLGHAHQVGPLGVQPLGDFQHVAGAARQSADAVRHQRHALGGGLQRRVQALAPVHAGPADPGILEHGHQLGVVEAAPGFDLGPLRRQAHALVGLPLSAHPDVADCFCTLRLLRLLRCRYAGKYDLKAHGCIGSGGRQAVYLQPLHSTTSRQSHAPGTGIAGASAHTGSPAPLGLRLRFHVGVLLASIRWQLLGVAPEEPGHPGPDLL
jgi:hypothetical protein